MEPPALQQVRHREGDPLGRGVVAVGLCQAGTTGEAHTLPVPGHQPRVLEGTAAPVAGQRRHHPRAVPVALPDVHVPLRLARMPQAVAQVEARLGP